VVPRSRDRPQGVEVNPRHRHHWMRDAKRCGVFVCMCGCTMSQTSSGWRVSRQRRKSRPDAPVGKVG
jgi:hypothetical protein